MVAPTNTANFPLSPTVIVGDVSMGAGVTLAPGVLIQVAPGSRLVLEAGVCVASGTVIRVHGGTLHLGAGCSVATGVILLGAGRVGSQACIGADSTVVNPDLAPQTVVPAGTWQGASADLSPTPEEVTSTPSPTAVPPAPQPPETASASAPSSLPPGGILATHTVIYGREQVLQLIQTLFPHRQSLSPPPQAE